MMKRESTDKRLSFGEYETSDRNVSRFIAQNMLLEAIKDIAPEVLQYLRDESFSVYGREGEFAPAFFKSLRTWAEQFNLQEEWCRTVAINTVRQWAGIEPIDGQLDWCYWNKLHLKSANKTKEPFILEFRHWEPVMERKKAYEDEAKKEFESQLRAYTNQLCTTAKALGFVQVAKKYNKDHFAWLVRYQVQQISRHKVAEEFGVEEKTMVEALRRTAELVELSLRQPLPPGKKSRKLA